MRLSEQSDRTAGSENRDADRKQRPPFKLTTAQLDRAAGVLLAMACGDALGAGYEFGPPLGAADVP